ncbi:hypothetical protein Fmac_029956 [Flemingia macrophylla]|uniref:BI1-like protein n=1 Tax=Flemingia macrophylla TaxID=520843 RepID=A0ABD1LBT7_9FABA
MMMKRDVESGGGGADGGGLYPTMVESPQLRWSFIRKVYTILTLQLLLTIAVAAVAVFVRPVALFFVSSTTGLLLFIILIFLPFITLRPLYYYHRKHPLNYFLLLIFTVTLAFAIGLTCAFTSGDSLLSSSSSSFTLHKSCNVKCGGKKLLLLLRKIILESVILTTVVVFSLTIYTFWAARRGHDFNFLGPFLFGALLVLLVFSLIQILFPLGKLSLMIYGCLASIIFCGYIIYDTDNLIKRFSYDEYIGASVSLYLDVINLFLALLSVFRAAN